MLDLLLMMYLFVVWIEMVEMVMTGMVDTDIVTMVMAMVMMAMAMVDTTAAKERTEMATSSVLISSRITSDVSNSLLSYQHF